jgi:hypothetical protein
MPKPSVSTLRARSRSFMSYSVQAEIIQNLNIGLRRLSSHLETNRLSKSQDGTPSLNHRGEATVEYGRLLEEISALLFYANLEGLQRVMLADQSYMNGDPTTAYIDMSGATNLRYSEHIDQLSERLQRLESWVVNE